MLAVVVVLGLALLAMPQARRGFASLPIRSHASPWKACITSNSRTRQEALRPARSLAQAKAVIIHVNSPGGTTAGSGQGFL